MKQLIAFLQSSFVEMLGLALLMGVYWWATQMAGPPAGNELHLLEAAREAIANHRFFYPTYNEVLHIPVSPLLTVAVGGAYKLFTATPFVARAMVFVLALFSLFLFHTLAARMFHPGVGALAAGLILTTWGFFTHSSTANGVMLYFMLVIILFVLFYHWFDSAYRSRTYARSLYVHFILIGITLGLAFCAYGIPGVLFPLLVMGSTAYVGNKQELLADIAYQWLLVPFAAIVLVWSILGMISVGVLPFGLSLFKFHLSLAHLGEPFLYLLPILPLLLPGLLDKEMWSRALLTYQKSLLMMGCWLLWSLVFLIFCADFHETFSLLLIAPLVLWLGFHLGEVFRNPVMPFSLQLMIDTTVLSGLVVSVCLILLTFQMVPEEMHGRFIMLSFTLPVVSVVLFFLRDVTISRALPFYLIPSGLLLCILAKGSIEPFVLHQPAQDLAAALPMARLHAPQTTILEWTHDAAHPPSIIRFLTPLQSKVVSIGSQAQLESRIQTRQGDLFLILPESQWYNLPVSVRESAYPLSSSWQWREPLNLATLAHALRNEMLDFDALTEPVLLIEVPLNPDR